MKNSANIQINQDETVNPTSHESITPSLPPLPGETDPANPLIHKSTNPSQTASSVTPDTQHCVPAASLVPSATCKLPATSKRLVVPARNTGGSGDGQPATPPTINLPRRSSRKAGPSLAILPRRKIAQLPQKTRNSINNMIRDGVPLREICSHFRGLDASINKDNLLRWKSSGYRQWLKEEVRREDSHAKIRFLLGLVQEKKNNQILRATQQIAALQVADILTTLDHQSLRKSIQEDPAQYTRLLNALPRLAEAGLACERLQAEIASSRKSKPAEPGGLDDETLREIETQIGLL